MGLAAPYPRRNNNKNKSKNWLMRVRVGLAALADDREQGQIKQRGHYNGLERLRR